MTSDAEKYTVTMARLFAEQGYLRKAAEIYRHLLGLRPEDVRLRQALRDVEEQIARNPAPSRKELALMLREWKLMSMRYAKMKSRSRK